MPITEPAPAKINLALHIRRRRSDGYHDLETLFAFARDGDVITAAPAGQDSLTITGPFAESLNSSPARGGGPQAKPVVEGGQPHATPPAEPTPASPAKAGAQTRREAPTPERWIPASAGEAHDGGSQSSSTAQGGGSPPPDNLVTRARDAFRATFACPPVAIGLEKNLPIASGIGGGSADAAATLRALARLTGVDPHHSSLFEIAATLGADVPACLLGRPSLGFGKGDRLEPLPVFGDLPLLLVNPRVPLSTAQMFARWDGVDRGGIATDGSVLDRARAGRNDFTPAAIAAAPAVGAVLALLEAAPGAYLARMSGSGATCFALFDTPESRDATATAAIERGWWTLKTSLI